MKEVLFQTWHTNTDRIGCIVKKKKMKKVILQSAELSYISWIRHIFFYTNEIKTNTTWSIIDFLDFFCLNFDVCSSEEYPNGSNDLTKVLVMTCFDAKLTSNIFSFSLVFLVKGFRIITSVELFLREKTNIHHFYSINMSLFCCGLHNM